MQRLAAGERRVYSLKPAPFLLLAALFGAVGVATLILGRYGSSEGREGSASAGFAAILDMLPPPLATAIAYAIPAGLIALAAGAVWRVVGGKPAVLFTSEGATTYSAFGSKTIAWDNVRSVEILGDVITLAGPPKPVAIALSVINGPRLEIADLIRSELAARGVPF